MSHDLVFALCSVALLLGTIWLLAEVTHHPHDAVFPERPIQNFAGPHLNGNPGRGGIKSRVPASSRRPLGGGWSRIRQAIHARYSVRMAVR
jgi:hypothetical protein